MTENPFAIQKSETAAQVVETERAIQEVQAAMVIAKRFPRDQQVSMDKILQACTRPTLAQQALYALPKGGQLVTGPSIRLAEALAQNWGNLQFGIREIEQRDGISTVQAFAWDVESNTRQVREFQVKHERKARGSIARIDDPREIYEHVASQGVRRMRACILSVIPGDVQDAAISQCEVTQQNLEGAPEDQIKALVAAFEEIGVKRRMIEDRLGHRIDSTISAEIIQLRKIFRSLKDGMSSIEDWFKPDHAATSEMSAEIMKTARKEMDKTPQTSIERSREQSAKHEREPESQQKEEYRAELETWPQERDGILYDFRGIPWTEEIHAATKSCTTNGIWRKRRGVSQEFVDETESEYLEKKKAAEKQEQQVEKQDEDLGMFSEKWFNVGISQASSEDEVAEYEDVLRDTDLNPEVRAGIEGKIAARRAELKQTDLPI